jgi:hypothetical protein
MVFEVGRVKSIPRQLVVMQVKKEFHYTNKNEKTIELALVFYPEDNSPLPSRTAVLIRKDCSPP